VLEQEIQFATFKELIDELSAIDGRY